MSSSASMTVRSHSLAHRKDPNQYAYVRNGNFATTPFYDTTAWTSSGWNITQTAGANQPSIWWIGNQIHFSRGGTPVGGWVQQRIPTSAGRNYTLTYTQSRSGAGATALRCDVRDINSNTIIATRNDQTANPQVRTLTFTALGPIFIRFTDTTLGNPASKDSVLDNVSISMN